MNHQMKKTRKARMRKKGLNPHGIGLRNRLRPYFTYAERQERNKKTMERVNRIVENSKSRYVQCYENRT